MFKEPILQMLMITDDSGPIISIFIVTTKVTMSYYYYHYP